MLYTTTQRRRAPNPALRRPSSSASVEQIHGDNVIDAEQELPVVAELAADAKDSVGLAQLFGRERASERLADGGERAARDEPAEGRGVRRAR